MAYSYVTYTSTGSKGPYAVTFSYLDEDHVKCTVDGASVSFSWTTTSTITLASTPSSGATIKIYRETSRDDRLVDFSDTSALDEEALDTSALQSFYLAQEAFDASDVALCETYDGRFDAEDKRIINIAAPVDDSDAATKVYVDDALAGVTDITDAVTAATAAASTAAAAATTATEAAETASTDLESATSLYAKLSSIQTAADNAAALAILCQKYSDQAAMWPSGAPSWDKDTTYNFPEVAVYTDGSIYRCIGTDIAGESPADGVHWVRINESTVDNLFDLDSDGALMPSTLSSLYSSVFELDGSSDIEPAESPVANVSFDLDDDGNIQPIS